MVMQSPNNELEINEYETLSDTQTAPDQPMLRIIGNSTTSLDELERLVAEFELDALAWHPSLLSVDVAAKNLENVDELQSQLAQDPRVRIVNFVAAPATQAN